MISSARSPREDHAGIVMAKAVDGASKLKVSCSFNAGIQPAAFTAPIIPTRDGNHIPNHISRAEGDDPSSVK